MMQDRVDRFFIAVHDLQNALGQTGFFEQFRQHQRHRGVALGGFQDKGVAAGNGRRKHPHGNHGWEIERGDARRDAKRLTHGVHINAGTGAVRKFAFQQMRCTNAIFHNF